MSTSSPGNLFVNDIENDLFFFETDHLALRGNKEYSEVLKTIVTLSAQRERAIQDFNKVADLKKKALENPLAILERLQRGEDLGLDIPATIELPKLPVINFDKFDVKVPESEIATIYSESVSENQDYESKKLKISNSNTSNQVWSPEEQKKLEELLLVYPPEAVEMRRFQKIADALGNRTVQQVSSRVQKYFLKLYKAGLPIPGRIPKSSEKYKKSFLHKHQRFNHYLLKPSTFFPDLYVPVTMNELENAPGPSVNSPAPSTSTSGSSNYLLHSEYHQNADLQPAKNEAEIHLQLLKRIKVEKLKEQDEHYIPMQHTGFKCDYCDSDPIVGARWHCLTCTETTDFCTDCVLSQLYSSQPHPLKHFLAVVHDFDNTPAIPSDSESVSGSLVTNKNYETDSSSSSEDLDNTNHPDNSRRSDDIFEPNAHDNYQDIFENDV